MNLSVILATAALLATPPQTLDDVVALTQGELTATEVVSQIESSGLYFPVTGEQLVKLYFAGLPVDVLTAIIATSGETQPTLASRGATLELLYSTHRVVGRMGAKGPELVITGFANDGSRLTPPVEAPAEPLPVQRVEAEPVRELPWPAPTPTVVAQSPRDEPRLDLSPEFASPVDSSYRYVTYPYVTHHPYGYVSVTSIPRAYRDGRVLVTPGHAPAFGFGHYGYGTPWYGAYGAYAGQQLGGHRSGHSGSRSRSRSRVVHDHDNR